MPGVLPPIPGIQVRDPEFLYALKSRVKMILNLNNDGFPGSQPVSFTKSSLDILEKEDFFVCEKSDGVRCLLLLMSRNEGTQQEVYLIDRKNHYYEVTNMWFPMPNESTYQHFHSDTIIDGELVQDVEPDGTQLRPMYLAFDCLCCDGKNLMQRNLTSRLGYLKEFIIRPHQNLLKAHPVAGENQPFEIVLKPMQFSYHLAAVFESQAHLKHPTDGLIFTSSVSSYNPGTDQKILKWKPAEENSIDFKLQVDLPPHAEVLPEADDDGTGGIYDTDETPCFRLLVWNGGRDYKHFDKLIVTEEEWEEWKRVREPLQGRIIEVAWDPERNDGEGGWKALRFRDDKNDGNYRSVVESIQESIRDGVEKEKLIERSSIIRKRWKERHGEGY